MNQNKFVTLFREAAPTQQPDVAAPNAHNVISKAQTLEQLLNKSGNGKYPLFVKITNGNYTGALKTSSEYYQIDFNHPVTKQIDGYYHELTASGKRTGGVGVMLYVDTVLKSRNVVINNSGQVAPSHTFNSGTLLKLASGVSVKSGVMSFDYSVMRLLSALKVKLSAAEGPIDVYGSIGKNLTMALLDCLPKQINGSLIFVDKNAPGVNVQLPVANIAGSFRADGINFDWKPVSIGSRQEDSTLISGSAMIPDFSGTKMKCSLLITKSKINFDRMPKAIAGTVSLVGNGLTEIPAWNCNIGGNLILAGNIINFGASKGGATIHGDLVISEKSMKQGGVTEEVLRKLFDVKGKIVDADDAKAISANEDMFRYFQPEKKQANDYIKMLQRGIEHEFGDIGKATLGKWLNKITKKL